MIGTHQASRMLPSDAPTRIAIRRPSPVFVGHGRRADQRSADERVDQFAVPLEAAGREHDAAVARLTGLAVLEAHAGHPAVVDDEFDGAHPRARLDAAVEAGLEQRTDQALPGAALVVDLAALEFLRRDAVRCAAAEAGLAHHDVAGQLRADRHLVLPLAELVEREQRAFQRAPAAALRARVLGVVVGEVLDDLESGRACAPRGSVTTSGPASTSAPARSTSTRSCESARR